ncbi:MAG: HlyD family type I secretion periplasmic adaptor subunit, partial [Pseudomonadota bacterium]
RAPLAAAVISQGSFVATGRNKIVQHLEGGIIREILAQEGDFVVAGEPILLLDPTAALANERELFLRQTRLAATEARLLAEYGNADALVFPDYFTNYEDDTEVTAILEGQKVAFDVSRDALETDIALLRRNIAALEIRAEGYDQQLAATRAQHAILQEELDDKKALLDGGLVRRQEVNALRRAHAEVDGQIARLIAEVAEITEIKKKYDAQITQAESEARNAALDELQLVQAELDSIREQTRKARNVLERVEVTAPVSGTVVRLYYHTAGGVIETGKPIAEILPADEPLIIEAQVPRTEIDQVNTGQMATVRLIALNQRTTPVLSGEVFYVSADAIIDRSIENSPEIYIARVSVTPEEMGRVINFSPTPGMPVEIMIQTAERTFVQYLTKPITDSMTRAFREQ